MPVKELRVADALFPSRNVAAADLLRFGRGAVAVVLRFIRNAGAHASHGLRENVAALRIFRGLASVCSGPDRRPNCLSH
jgi:hypothetical protein